MESVFILIKGKAKPEELDIWGAPWQLTHAQNDYLSSELTAIISIRPGKPKLVWDVNILNLLFNLVPIKNQRGATLAHLNPHETENGPV